MTPRFSIVVLLLCGLNLPPVVADTINVPDDQPTIAAAISASVDGDVIDIAAGIYTEHSLSTSGKAITIQGALDASGGPLTTIDAQQNGRIFIINSGEGANTVIQHLVITGGGGPSASPGGGIYCFGAAPIIRGCTISGNTTSTSGGGIFLERSNATITDCSIESNTANLEGGGIIAIDSSPTITNCSITSNTASNGGGLHILGIPLPPCKPWDPDCENESGPPTASVTLTDCRMESNSPNNFVINDNGVGLVFNTSASVLGDADGDGDVDLDDRTAVDDALGLCAADIDGDGQVDGADLSYVLGYWGLCSAP